MIEYQITIKWGLVSWNFALLNSSIEEFICFCFDLISMTWSLFVCVFTFTPQLSAPMQKQNRMTGALDPTAFSEL